MVGLRRKYGGWHRCQLSWNLWPNSQWGARGSTEEWGVWRGGADWISNWMEPKSFVVGKTRRGWPDWGFRILHPEDLHSDRGRVGAQKSIIFHTLSSSSSRLSSSSYRFSPLLILLKPTTFPKRPWRKRKTGFVPLCVQSWGTPVSSRQLLYHS